MPSQVPSETFRLTDLPAAPTAVLFTADWCGYCRIFQPDFDDLPNGVVVDVSDEDDPLWDELRIRVVPTVIVFRDRVPVKRWAGALRAAHAAEIRAALEA